MPANLAVKWEQVGEDEFGTPQFNLRPPDGHEDEEMHFLVTGNQAAGEIVLPSGLVYNVAPSIIRVASPEHAGLLSHHIGIQHEQTRRLGFGLERREERHPETGELLVATQPHLCTEHCGELARQTTAADAYRDQQALLASGAFEAAAANGGAAVIAFVNLHSASPGTTGTSELGSTRQGVAWTTATSGSPNPSNTGALSITLAASTTATHLGGWTLVSAGVYELGFPLSPTVTTGTSAGTVTFAVGAVAIGIT